MRPLAGVPRRRRGAWWSAAAICDAGPGLLRRVAGFDERTDGRVDDGDGAQPEGSATETPSRVARANVTASVAVSWARSAGRSTNAPSAEANSTSSPSAVRLIADNSSAGDVTASAANAPVAASSAGTAMVTGAVSVITVDDRRRSDATRERCQTPASFHQQSNSKTVITSSRTVTFKEHLVHMPASRQPRHSPVALRPVRPSTGRTATGTTYTTCGQSWTHD